LIGDQGMTLKVIIEQGIDGFFVAHCPSLKSCWSQGRTREEALENVREAITLYLEPNPADSDATPGREVVDLTL
jgi:predicted RNase H-like HicB family nuclease